MSDVCTEPGDELKDQEWANVMKMAMLERDISLMMMGYLFNK